MNEFEPFAPNPDTMFYRRVNLGVIERMGAQATINYCQLHGIRPNLYGHAPVSDATRTFVPRIVPGLKPKVPAFPEQDR